MRPFEASNYIEIKGKKYLYLNDDNPAEAYKNNSLSFVAQPLPIDSKDHNVVVVPLMMTDEWEIIKNNPSFINEVRLSSINKQTKFNFMGQSSYAGREVFRNLKLPNYLYKETQSVYGLPKKQKHEKLIEFLYKIGHSEFVFCPRGIGSSSFRAFQSFMVGSIPIITGMNEYPFEDEVVWDSMCLRGTLEDLPRLIQEALRMSLDAQMDMREKGMRFWDEYCKHDKLHEKLKEMV